MSDRNTLALLLEFVQNPLVMGNYQLYKYEKEDFEELAKNSPEMRERITQLAETTEKTMTVLIAEGINVEYLRYPYSQISKTVN